jgi:hypothetical protein
MACRHAPVPAGRARLVTVERENGKNPLVTIVRKPPGTEAPAP